MIKFEESALHPSAGHEASVAGFANEHIVLAVLMTKFPNSSLVNMPLASYDIIIERQIESHTRFLRAQVKTATTAISFTGGSRGGVDRTYDKNQNVDKTYVQDVSRSDLVIGIHRGTETILYLIPSLIIPLLHKKSLSVKKSAMFSNWIMIDICDNELELKKFFKGEDKPPGLLCRLFGKEFVNWVYS